MKRILKLLALLLIGLIIAIILVPVFFEDELIDAVKSEINKNINAEVDFKSADVSFFKSLPKISVDLHELNITGINDFEGTDLLQTKTVHLETDFKSLFKSSEGITLYNIVFDEPHLNIVINEDGKPNYDIQKKSDQSVENSLFGNIESYSVYDGTLNYSDYNSSMFMHLEDIDHTGKGNFRAVTFDLETVSDIGSIDYKMNGISYLSKAKAKANIDLAVDLNANTYTFKKNQITINDLNLSFVGLVKKLSEGFDLDLSFNAPDNKVSSIFSFVPSVYTADYNKIRSDGKGKIVGIVKGIYNSARKQYPAIDIKMDVDNGTIQYPNLPIPIKDILLDMTIKSDKADWSDLTVHIPKFNFDLDGDKMEGKLDIDNALSNAEIDGNIKGKLDLKKLSDAFPMDGMELNSGSIISDVNIKANKSDILNKNYNNIVFDGEFEGSNIDIVNEGKIFKAASFDSKLNPRKADINFVNARYGNSDFDGNIRTI